MHIIYNAIVYYLFVFMIFFMSHMSSIFNYWQMQAVMALGVCNLIYDVFTNYFRCYYRHNRSILPSSRAFSVMLKVVVQAQKFVSIQGEVWHFFCYLINRVFAENWTLTPAQCQIDTIRAIFKNKFQLLSLHFLLYLFVYDHLLIFPLFCCCCCVHIVVCKLCNC